MSDNGPWLSDEQQTAWRAYIEVRQRLDTHLYRHLQRDFGLSGADYEVLVNLSESAAGRMRAFELGEMTRWEKSRLSHHIKRMEQRGLVRREACAGSRFPDIVLTDEGWDAIRTAAPKHAANVRAFFGEGVGDERLDVFAAACKGIVAAIDEHERTSCPLEDSDDR
ncbi:MarR family winged helix-turn-helix transcriptional regulator [Kribbella deserti]|uniref:MarR family winged helix-turn-helix transcriptional regulator n=1 Tax=Kribbella deserti TaxID=1926257 RepID=A0ABV6QEY7_9ACTN